MRPSRFRLLARFRVLGRFCVLAFLLSLALIPGIAGAQDDPVERTADLPDGVVARVYGRDITVKELQDRLARTYEGTQRGREVLNELVDDLCVEREATRRNVSVSDEELQEYFARWDETIRKQSGGQASLADLYEEASSREEFDATAREFLLRQKMARTDLGSKPGEELPEHRLKIWLSSVRRKQKVMYAGAPGVELPPGVLARVDDLDVHRDDLARKLYDKLPIELTSSVRNELVLVAAAEHHLEARNLSITDADVEAAIVELRERFSEEPQVQGTDVTFDQFLKQTRGFGEDALRGDRAFRARIGLRRMKEAEVSDAEVRTFWEENQKLYGERAMVRQIFVAAAGPGNEFGLPTYKEAWEAAIGAKAEVFEGAGLHLPVENRPAISTGTALTRVAKRLMRDEEKRQQAGEPRVWTQLTTDGEDGLVQAVFEGPIGELQGPVRSGVGYHLLVVDERRAAPTFEEARRRVHADLVQKEIQKFQIEMRDDPNVVFAAQ